jgi:anti-sigma-K factor RskA
MIRLNAELRDALAAEYVLGTQSRRVRARLARMIAEDEQLAERVTWWETQLESLADSVSPVPAPPWVWRRIENALQPSKERKESWWGNVLVWRWSTALAGALALMLVLLPPPVPRPDVITPEGGVVLVLMDDDSRTAWLVSRKSAQDPIKAQPLNLPVLTEQQAYELWLLPPEAAPLSVGLLNDEQTTELTLDQQLGALLQPGLGMAVSLEPAGGSPTGAPTGPVVFTGSIREL